MKYRVLWAMDLEGETPLGAAKEALGYIVAAQLFTIYEEEDTGIPRRIFKVNLLDASTEEIEQ